MKPWTRWRHKSPASKMPTDRRHSGFNVHCGPRIQPGEEEVIENLARHIICTSFSQERMTYIPEEPKVVYRSKNGKEEKIFDALEWLAAMCSHVPNKGEQMVRYYGYYSNVSRGKRHKENQDGLIHCILGPEKNSKEYRKNWTRLIQKIYEIDPLTCPICQGQMRIISFIEGEEGIRNILKYLGLWLVKKKPSPRANAPPVHIHLDYSARPGATHLAVAAQTMHSSKHDFLRIQCW